MLLNTMTRLFPLWAVIFSALAYSFPESFDHLGYLISHGLSLIMLFMGLTLSVNDFARIKDRLPALYTGVMLQFGIMPFAGLLIAQLLSLPVDLTIGMILAGSVAGGTASNVLCYLAKGDVALSISMTALSTLTGAFATPLLISLLAHQVARTEPVMLCQMLKKVAGRAAAGVKNLVANTTARPEFCIPTSMATVLQVFRSKPDRCATR